MTKELFCECVDVLKNYSEWERKLDESGLGLYAEPVLRLVDKFQSVCGLDSDWVYDTKEGLNWVVEWIYLFDGDVTVSRHGRDFLLNSAGALYDFIVFMNEHGWED